MKNIIFDFKILNKENDQITSSFFLKNNSWKVINITFLREYKMGIFCIPSANFFAFLLQWQNLIWLRFDVFYHVSNRLWSLLLAENIFKIVIWEPLFTLFWMSPCEALFLLLPWWPTFRHYDWTVLSDVQTSWSFVFSILSTNSLNLKLILKIEEY